tara:strand:+ start:600 stop:770 length:171 start_codon:yes stop_codon:yes gene_type:complete
MNTLNRYGNPLASKFENYGYMSVDRDTRDGRFVSQIKRNQEIESKVSWFRRVFFSR